MTTFKNIRLIVCDTQAHATQKAAQLTAQGFAATIETVTGSIGYDTLEFCDTTNGIADTPPCKWLVTGKQQ